MYNFSPQNGNQKRQPETAIEVAKNRRREEDGGGRIYTEGQTSFFPHNLHRSCSKQDGSFKDLLRTAASNDKLWLSFSARLMIYPTRLASSQPEISLFRPIHQKSLVW